MEEQAKEMIARVQKSENYYQALNIISEYVETELSVQCETQKKCLSFWNVCGKVKTKVKNSQSADKKG